MSFHKRMSLVYGITFTRLLMSCPSGKMENEVGSCVDCPAGYFDHNCSKVCSNNTYGLGCRNICLCSPEYCDPAIGCIQLPTTTIETTKTETRLTDVKGSPVQTDPVTFNLLLIVLAVVGCHFILTVTRIIRKWMNNKNVRRKTGNVADSSPMTSSDKPDKPEGSEGIEGEIIELHSDYYEPPIIPTERPGNNVYTGIRIV